jgi:hypothetical protein
MKSWARSLTSPSFSFFQAFRLPITLEIRQRHPSSRPQSCACQRLFCVDNDKPHLQFAKRFELVSVVAYQSRQVEAME